MSKQLKHFTVSYSPFEEFELIISWHTYQRLGEDADQYNLLFESVLALVAHSQNTKATVLLDYLGANGFSTDHRFFILVLDKESKTYDIQRLMGSVNPGVLFECCDKLQFENKAQLIQSVVHSYTKSIEEVFAENTKVFG